MGKKFLRGINLSLSLLIIISTFSSCANEMNIFEGNNNKQINFLVSVPEWKNTDSLATTKISRATPIMDTSFGTDKSFKLIADQNNGTNSYTTLIGNEPVTYSNNLWKTSNDYYWSGIANKTISFYAYYPSTISNVSHTAGSSPILSYTVPDNVSDQIDIMTAINNNVSGNTNSSTPLTFNHIFSAVQFNIGSSGMPNGTITGIALNNILCKGTYNFDGTWTQDATTKKSFSQTVSSSTAGHTVITSGPTTFMMMPQTLGSDASITVTYSNGGSLTKSISGTWAAGKIYTYNVSKTIPVANFAYTGSVQTYIVPLTGTYKLEVWGAEGGYGWDMTAGGKGGYSFGYVRLYKDQIIYIVVGGSGNPGSGRTEGGYNGGGQSNSQIGPDGGGATHISTTNRGILSNYSNNQNDILIVAGGGGGSERNMGGSGGGLSGISGSIGWICSWDSGQLLTHAECGTQTSGGIAGTTSDKGNAEPGCFGKGGNGYISVSQDAGGAGGGGWYGGGGIAWYGGGGGGSGYIGGVIDGQTIAGDSPIPSTSGGTENGNTGDGYARITFASAN